MELNFDFNFEHFKVKMILLHNGIELPETEMYSYSDVHAHDMASRTTVSNFEKYNTKFILRKKCNFSTQKSRSHQIYSQKQGLTLLLPNKVCTKYNLRKKSNSLLPDQVPCCGRHVGAGGDLAEQRQQAHQACFNIS